KVSLLLNRKNLPHRGTTENENSRLNGLTIEHDFPNDYSDVQDATLKGVPVPQQSGLGKSILALAQSIAPAVARHDLPPHHRHKFLEFFRAPSEHQQQAALKD
ncbi:MAG: hypothetical protein ABSH31_10845, partial [Bryobacteraceae bacterium]